MNQEFNAIRAHSAAVEAEILAIRAHSAAVEAEILAAAGLV